MQLTMVRQTAEPKQPFATDMDTILGVIWAQPNEPLTAFSGHSIEKSSPC